MADAPGTSEPVLVTGATGFIGSAVVRALLDAGYPVRALCEPERDDDNLAGLNVDRIVGDIRDRHTLDEAVAGVSTVFHLAAVYRFWAADPDLFYDVNVGGALNVVRAVERAGCRRLVYTSTVGTIGVAERGRLASEDSLVHFEHLFGHYKRSKYLAEHEVLRAGAAGLPVVLVHPTFPVGERDTAPTPTGRTIVEFLNGRIPGFVDTALNVVHVDDVAHGHVLAAQRGAPGRSYILGGENMTLQEMLTTLADLCGLAAPRIRVSPRAVLPIVRGAEWLQSTVLHREPTLPSEPVRMATTRMEYDTSRARTELGYTSLPARTALARAARWFVDHGFVKPSQVERIRRAGRLGDEIDLRDDVPDPERPREKSADR
ncbi:MAG TPA: hopanoid-associated sugar epimerase [Acidimicrobiia bacterium]|nr:hopanoid-associated sugar epimerase [Acidimicrobiia bacterium]